MINIPTLVAIYNGILADLQSEFSVVIPLFGKSFLRIFASVQAAKIKVLYLNLAKVQKNIFVDTADPESTGGTLERFGRVKLGRNPFPATPGKYSVQLYGTAGAVVPASTTFKSNDTSLSPGKLFVLDETFVLAGSDIIILRALEAGLDSKLAVGDQLTVTAPIALVEAVVDVLTETDEPVSAESIEDYRRKALDSYRLEAQGGSAADLRLWSSDAPGVELVYPYARSGYTAEVNLFVEATPEDSVDGKGTPSVQILADVEAAIEQPTADRPARFPLGIFKINYIPVSVKEIDIEISGFSGITMSQQALILNAVTAALSKVRPFVSAIDILSLKNDIFDVNKVVSIIISAVPGSSFGAVVMNVDTVPVFSYTFIDGNIPHLNSISYV